MRSVIVCGLVLLGCGDNVAVPSLTPQSGERLQLRWFEYEDGTRQLDPGVFHDRVLGATCTPRRWSDGYTYCTPVAAGVVYTDAACTAEVGRSADAAAPFYLREFTLGGTTSPSRLYRPSPGAELAPPEAIWQRFGGACVGPGDAAGYRYFALDEVAPARVRRSEPIGDGRLQLVLHTSDDGASVPFTLRDRVLDDDCTPVSRVGTTSTECAPASTRPAYYYRDPACTELLVSVPRTAAQPSAASLDDERSGCTTYFAVGDQVIADPLYRRAGASCIAVTLPIDERAFALGAPLDLPVLARRHEAVPGRRLQPVRLAAGDVELPDPLLFDGDPARRAECRRIAVDGGTRCLPALGLVMDVSYFRDEICTVRAPFALVASGRCDTPAPYTYETVPADGIAVHTLAAPYPGTLYEISTADTCLPYVPPPRFVPYLLGPALPLAAFPSAHLVIE